MIPKQCKQCGTVLTFPKWLAKQRKFCSRKCYIASAKIAVSPVDILRLYKSGMTISEVAVALDTTDKVVYSRMVRYSLPRRSTAVRNQQGNKNSGWKGDVAKYSTCHTRVEKLRGKPSVCEQCGTTTSKRFEWANISRKYYDPFDYRRLCCSCHRKEHKIGLNFHKRRVLCTIG